MKSNNEVIVSNWVMGDQAHFKVSFYNHISLVTQGSDL